MKSRIVLSAVAIFCVLLLLTTIIFSIVLNKKVVPDGGILPPVEKLEIDDANILAEVPPIEEENAEAEEKTEIKEEIPKALPPSEILESTQGILQESSNSVIETPKVETANDIANENIGFEILETTTYPGEYLTIYAYNIENKNNIKVENPFGVTAQFFQSGDHYVAFLPVKYTYEAGQYIITCSGEGFSETFTITLQNKEWQTQYLTVDTTIASQTIQSTAANDEYYAKVHPKKTLFDDNALWDGEFIQPVAGRITTEFGMIRYTNGVAGDRHGGVDIAATLGTPIVASNGGKVLFADFIALTGNTICIEHGMGIKTWYYHMDSLTVKENDIVTKGQQIGTVGSTGFSTGPHLHWATSVFGTYVNPWSLINEAPKN